MESMAHSVVTSHPSLLGFLSLSNGLVNKVTSMAGLKLGINSAAHTFIYQNQVELWPLFSVWHADNKYQYPNPDKTSSPEMFSRIPEESLSQWTAFITGTDILHAYSIFPKPSTHGFKKNAFFNIMEVYRTLFLINETIFLTTNYGNGPVIIVFTGPVRLIFLSPWTSCLDWIV